MGEAPFCVSVLGSNHFKGPIQEPIQLGSSWLEHQKLDCKILACQRSEAHDVKAHLKFHGQTVKRSQYLTLNCARSSCWELFPSKILENGFQSFEIWEFLRTLQIFNGGFDPKFRSILIDFTVLRQQKSCFKNESWKAWEILEVLRWGRDHRMVSEIPPRS